MAAAALMLLSACGGGPSTSSTTATKDAGAVQRGGTLEVASAGELTSLDPNLGNTDPFSQHAQVLIFDRLLTVEPGSAELKPGLAESWKLSDDKRSMTFKLRDAKFSDGSPVTSADVKFSLSRALDEKVDPNFAASLQQLIASVSTPDPRTVVLHFDGPAPAILPYMSFVTTSIVSKKAFERIGAKRFATAPLDAGSGPFKLVKWVKGQRVELVRNPHYWRKGLPYLDAVNLLYVPDDNTRLLELRSGGIDIADDVPYSQLDAIGKVSGVELKVTPVAAVFGPFLSGRGPLKDVKVRQALNYATPREAIRKIAMQGRGELANSVIPPMKYADKSVVPIPLDVEKAKELLASSNQPNGFDLEMLVQSGDAVSRQAASMLQDAWKDIGVNLKVRSIESSSLFSRFFSGDYDSVLFAPTTTSSDTPSEDQWVIQFTTPVWEKILAHADPELHELIEQINGTWDEGVRRPLISQYLRRMQENPVFVPIAVTSARTAMSDKVHGFDYTLLNWLYLDRTWIEQ